MDDTERLEIYGQFVVRQMALEAPRGMWVGLETVLQNPTGHNPQ